MTLAELKHQTELREEEHPEGLKGAKTGYYGFWWLNGPTAATGSLKSAKITTRTAAMEHQSVSSSGGILQFILFLLREKKEGEIACFKMFTSAPERPSMFHSFPIPLHRDGCSHEQLIHGLTRPGMTCLNGDPSLLFDYVKIYVLISPTWVQEEHRRRRPEEFSSRRRKSRFLPVCTVRSLFQLLASDSILSWVTSGCGAKRG